MVGVFFKILNLLNKKQKISYLLLLLSILISSVLDLFGIASIFPFIFLISNLDVIETNKIINFFYILLINLEIIQTKESFIILSGVLTLFFLILSIFFRSLSYTLTVRFSLNFEKTMNLNLLKTYLYKPYVYFLDKNSTNIYKKIITQTRDIVDRTVYPSVSLITNLFMITLILLFLMYLNPHIFFNTFFILIIFFLSSFYFFRKKFRSKGQDEINYNEKNLNTLFNIFSSIKNTKVNQLEESLFRYYSEGLKESIKSRRFIKTISGLPRQLLELFGFMIIIIAILINISNKVEIIELIPILTVYALSGYRLLPSIQHVYFALTNIEYSNLAFKEMFYDLKHFKYEKNFIKKNKKSILPFSENIKLKNVSFKYPKSKNLVLNNINLNIKAYSKIGIVGSSGSGKTTLLDIIMGLMDPTKGKIFVDNCLLIKKNISSWQSNIGYVTQNIKLFNESIEDNIINLEKENYNKKHIEEVSKVSLIHDFIVKQLPHKYKTNIGDDGSNLSGGQKQRVGIARALYSKPKLLILDEATNSLDPETEVKILKSLFRYANKKITIIIVSHNLQTLKYCDKIYSISKSKLKKLKNENET
jgi:ABC-type bacteriocin/lantibiotic exporter with double-glycine peptidase domain